MKKFCEFIQEIKDKRKYETTGEALASFIWIADNAISCDWRVDDLDELTDKVRHYFLIEEGER